MTPDRFIRARELSALSSAAAVLAVFSLALGCARVPAPLRALPDFSLTAVTSDGVSPLDLRALRGRVWIADFMLTRCAGSCLGRAEDMADLQRRLPSSVGFLSFSMDPDHDSPEVLAVHAKEAKADSQRWYFVTGDRSAVERLLRDGFQIEAAASAARFALIDGDGRVRGCYGDDRASLDRLAADASRL